MPKYEVAFCHTEDYITEVEADNPEDAIMAAFIEVCKESGHDDWQFSDWTEYE
jgi:hypothetical protein